MDLFDNPPPVEIKLGGNTKETARNAAEILLALEQGYAVPSGAQRKNLLIAFAEQGLTLYGKAFDIVKGPTDLDLNDLDSIRKNFSNILIFEIKSTNKATVKPDFAGHFFSISTAELLTAQNLGSRYRFIFVNTLTKTTKEFSLQEVYAKARGIYPSWSIQF